MSKTEDVSTSYDELPYTSFPYPQTHPRNLSAIAQLFAMSPADVGTSRILELGCAGGGNLIPIASTYPSCQCVGIDASRRQIEEAIQLSESLGLSNIDLRHQDIDDFEWQGEPFDYVLCHGVYSWVPRETQRRLLAICQECLADQGIAFVSYNTYPGWYLRRGVREMMGFHASGFSDTQTKINQSRALVDFLAGAVRTEGDSYDQLLREELGILRSSEDSYVYHEHLEKDNEPLFFYQFVERAEDAQLRYLADAQFSTMVPSDFSESTQSTLRSIAPGIVQMEQYLDFLRNRKFRQSLLCRAEIQPDRSIEPSRLQRLSVSAPLTEVDSQTDSEWLFEHASGQRFSATDAVTANLFRILSGLWPRSIALSDLGEQAGGFEHAAQSTLELFAQGLVSLTSAPIDCQTDVSFRPQTSELVRSQAEHVSFATNQRHERVPLDAFDRAILVELDGTRDLNEIRERVAEKASNPDGSPLETDQLQSAIEAAIYRFAQATLLTS